MRRMMPRHRYQSLETETFKKMPPDRDFLDRDNPGNIKHWFCIVLLSIVVFCVLTRL